MILRPQIAIVEDLTRVAEACRDTASPELQRQLEAALAPFETFSVCSAVSPLDLARLCPALAPARYDAVLADFIALPAISDEDRQTLKRLGAA